jgi:hypothetical protein
MKRVNIELVEMINSNMRINLKIKGKVLRNLYGRICRIIYKKIIIKLVNVIEFDK